jgi:hypothetical protein
MKKRDFKSEQKSLSQFFKADPSNAPKLVHDGPADDGNLKIWHWNVNGIRACINSKKFEEFIVKGK